MTGKDAIEEYGLITLIFSFLQTWSTIKPNKDSYKRKLFNKHIVTVKSYITTPEYQRKALIALHFFSASLKSSESQRSE